VNQIDKKYIGKFDKKLLKISKKFLIIGPLSWDSNVKLEFFKNLSKNNLILPEVTYPKISYNSQITELKNYLKEIRNEKHPALIFLARTAQSYLDGFQILEGVGTQNVNKFSRIIYGSPQDLIKGYQKTNLQVAKYFLKTAKRYENSIQSENMIYSASDFAKKLRQEIKVVLPSNIIEIFTDRNITAKAAAGPNYVKINQNYRFSEADLRQLLHHEIMTHTLTYINGRKQSTLKTLGYSAPRITATQEGLAIFSEYMNFAIELTRLKRIALRIIALDKAEQGADFIELFKFFRKHGQNEEESYGSASRILRGGTAKGGIYFYKDNVYLQGLFAVESFLKESLHSGLINDMYLLFSGKLTIDDIKLFKPLSEEGYIDQPEFLPEWLKNTGELATHLTINDLTERFKPKIF